MISIKDYAEQKNVSYEAIRQQINRYRNDLGEHIKKENRTQFLDDEAIAFLDERRKTNPIIITQDDTRTELEELKFENKMLLIKLNEKQEKIELLLEELKLYQSSRASKLNKKHRRRRKRILVKALKQA